jgi:hypothetical protein
LTAAAAREVAVAETPHKSPILTATVFSRCVLYRNIIFMKKKNYTHKK